MVAVSKLLSRQLAVLSKVPTWVSTQLSAAALLGLLLVALLAHWLPASPAPASAPVGGVRAVTVPLPVAEAKPATPARAMMPPAWVKDRPAKILQIVARRVRDRRLARPGGESGALGKPGMNTPSADKAPVAPPAEPKAAAPAEPKAAMPAEPKSTPAKAAPPPEPDEWSDAEIIAALRDCLRRLAPLGADIEIAQPVKQERCGAPAPVVLKRIGSGATRVEFQPPAMLNCAMVASLSTWIEKTLQPAAQELLGSPVVRIRNYSGYVCRNRIGTVFHADRLSEHALANAIDIAAFVTADGRTVDVLGQWGPTARDLRDKLERAAEAATAARTAAKEAEREATQAARAAARAPRGPKRDETNAEAARKKDEAQRKSEEAERLEAEHRDVVRLLELHAVGRTKDAAPLRLPRNKERTADTKGLVPIPVSKEGARPALSAEAAFLRQLHRGACGTFGTVLGPNANEAHRNHFHFDLAARKRAALCE
jgi:hypothetical protein